MTLSDDLGCCWLLQVERGRSDALAWAEAVGFTRNGQPVFPTAQHLESLRQQLFRPAWAAGAVDATQAMGAAAAASGTDAVFPGTVGLASATAAGETYTDRLPPGLLVGQKLALQAQLHSCS